MNLEKYRTLFVDEATEHVGEMGRVVALLAQGAPDGEAEEAIDTLFRMAHSIKGMAASMEYDSISQLAHRLEDRMEPLRGGATLGDTELELLSEVIGALEVMVGGVEEQGSAPRVDPDLLERLAAAPAKPAAKSRARKSAAAMPQAPRLKKKLPRSLRHRCRVPSACAQKRWTGFWPRWVN